MVRKIAMIKVEEQDGKKNRESQMKKIRRNVTTRVAMRGWCLILPYFDHDSDVHVQKH